MLAEKGRFICSHPAMMCRVTRPLSGPIAVASKTRHGLLDGGKCQETTRIVLAISLPVKFLEVHRLNEY